MTEEAGLPTGWIRAELGEVVEPSKERMSPSKVEETPYIGLEHIEKNTGRLLGSGTSTEVRSMKTRFRKGDLLYGRLRPYLNKVHVADFDGVCSTDILVFRGGEHISNKFLFYRMLSHDFVRYAHRNSSGVHHPRVSYETLSRFKLSLAPSCEQVRIVGRLEELFTRLDAGMESLHKARTQLKRYRQVVLKFAFEGKLTQEWRRTHEHETEPATKLLERIGRHKEINVKGKRKKSSTMNMPVNQELSEGWTYGRLEDWIYIAGRIGWRGLKAEEYTSEGPLFLSVYNLNRGTKVNFSEVQHITEERYEESPEIQLRNNDILLVKDGAGIGKIGIVDGLNTKATVNSSLLVIRGSDVFLPKFLLYFLMGPKMQEVVRMRITGSATPHLFQRDIKRFDVLIPPIAEQQKIVESIESSFSVADEVENTIEQGLRQAEGLRQSILQDAFHGKLVPQDPSDEPADELLERKRKEKAKSKDKKDANKGMKNKPKQLELSSYVK